MISVEEAKRIMMEHVPKLPADPIALDVVGSRYAASDMFAPYDHPLFDMSAVDGYAFAFNEAFREWSVIGEVPTGGVFHRDPLPGECVRIFTGAMLPEGTDTVVMQEFVQRTGDRINHTDKAIKYGGNVRRKGEQIKQGELVLRAGQLLDAAMKGLLASVGVSGVEVVLAPEVNVIVTGNELATEATLKRGAIFSSNDIMLAALIHEARAIPLTERVADDAALLEQAIITACDDADLVITTGGASVGDHDLIRPVLEKLGATIHFHGVAQKPGKPMLFATLNDKPIFGLPGNPRAVIVLFWEYVLPFLRAMQGAKDPWLKSDHVPLAHAVEVKGDRAEFRAAQVRGGQVKLLRDEGSHMLRSLVDADALAYLPATKRAWIAGEAMEVHYLPQ